MKHIFQKYSGIVILTLSLVLIFFLLYMLRNIILPFLIGLVLAYLLFPLVSWLERRFPKPRKWPSAKRILAIILVFIAVVTVMGTAGFYIITTMIDSFASIVDDAPEYASRAFDSLQGWFSDLREWLPAVTDQQVTDTLRNLGENLGNALRDLFFSAIRQVPSTFSYIAGFATLPIFLFYILKDREHLRNKLYSGLSQDASRHARNVLQIVHEVLGGYLRAQVIMGFFVGVMALIGLLIIDAPLAIGLATIAGVTELVPILGPWIGGGIAVLVVLAIAPAKVIWVIVIFLSIQLIENSLLVPRIQGHYLHIHPAIAIILIITGASIFGFWGLILTLPLASTLVRLYKYVIREAREDDAG